MGIPALAQPGTVDGEALLRLGLAAGPIAAASFLIPLYLFTRFDLSRARHRELRRVLDGRASSRG